MKHDRFSLAILTAILTAALTALFAAACGGVLEPPPEAGGGIRGGKGRVIISISGAGDLAPEEAESAAAAPRTLLPEWGALEYTLEFTRDGETAPDPALTETITALTLTREIYPGEYALKVSAYKAGTDEAVAEGGAAVTVNDGQAVSVTVSLAPCQTGTGSLDYAVTLPGGMTLTEGFLTLYPLSGGADPVNIDLSAGLSGIEEVPAGYYRARLSLYGVIDGAGKFAAKTAALHINDALSTTASYTLDPGDFTGTALYTAGSAAELASAFTAIKIAGGDNFTVLVNADFSSAPIGLTDAGYNGKTITLRSTGGGFSGVREISLTGKGSLFTMGAASSEPVLILRDITLKGTTGNNAALLRLDGGALIMEDGALVTGNTNSSSSSGSGSYSYGGGVYVQSGAFTMQGSASVSGNTAYSSAYSYGGGVYFAGGGTFTMQGGASVSGNTASSSSIGSYSYGGGVYVAEGIFTMQGGASVSGNTASDSWYSYGGGVYFAGVATFTMRDSASVSGNTASSAYSSAYSYGGGVYFAGGGTFTMQGSASVSGNTGCGVYVGGGTFTMQDGASVSGNTGGGVYFAGGGTFTMQGGASVSGNTASSTYSSYGGGVYIAEGTFTMQDSASVSGNTASSSSSSYGGGVHVAHDGTFTMQGGASVSGNTASYGGGVRVSGGTFTMQDDASVSGNTASSSGGGVYFAGGGTFTMQDDASVSGNTASASSDSGPYSYGGGVYVADGGTFTMQGGASVSGNTASASSDSGPYSYGGGVYVAQYGTFTMQDDASVSGNTASDSGPYSYGGGVYAAGGGTLAKTGGVIYGSDADGDLKNTAGTNGHAVYIEAYGSPAKVRDSTAGTEVALDSAVDGAAGGWETPPIGGITYSSVSGGGWTLQNDGRRKSPAIGGNSVTKARVSFTGNRDNVSITIQLDVSSESGYDFAFISTLDNADAAYNSGYYEGSQISGEQSVTVTIPVPAAGGHFVDIGYRKDSGVNGGSDCAWFRVIE